MYTVMLLCDEVWCRFMAWLGRIPSGVRRLVGRESGGPQGGGDG
jgi:hypothetical protein